MNAEQIELEAQFGREPWRDGQPVKIVHLTNSTGMRLSLMDVGATWLSCVVPVAGEGREVLLRAQNLQAHQEQTAYLGAVVGRYANRIYLGQFQLNDKTYQTTINNRKNSLHGGVNGFDKRRWQIESQTSQSVCFSLISDDGDQGYPGRLIVKVAYQLTDDHQVQIKYWAQGDQDCPVNLTNHAYFNLAAKPSKHIFDHQLQLDAQHYLPVTQELIPTGEWRKVRGSSFDFEIAKKIGQDFLTDSQQEITQGYDHAFILNPEKTDGLSDIATLIAPDKSLCMRVKTTKPSIQVYTGNFLSGIAGYDGVYQANAGIALETQYVPDGPNQTNFAYGYVLLEAHKTYQHSTCYQFQF
ncbi:MAG: galactose-1-epimerase [Vibrio sp.]